MASRLLTPKLKKKSKGKSSEEDGTGSLGLRNKTNESAESANVGAGSKKVAGQNDIAVGAIGGCEDVGGTDGVTGGTVRTSTSDRHSTIAASSGDRISTFSKSKEKESMKKRSKFWSFLTKKKPLSTLAKCSENPSDAIQYNDEDVVGIVHRAVMRANEATASPIQPAAKQARRLSMGAGAWPTGLANPMNTHLLQVVPPPGAPATLNSLAHLGGAGARPRDVLAEDPSLCQRFRDIDLDMSSNPIGYPHLRFNRSMSNSSSSSGSSGISVEPPLPAHSSVCVAMSAAAAYPAPTEMLLPVSAAGGSRGVSAEYSSAAGFQVPTGGLHMATVHTQVDYQHCLVPDLLPLTNCGFYWGVMDRYEAERLLENRPEGTFLVRDSAQEEFLFSVSFRRYGRSLHARIEQWNHRFSFDSHDLGVFASTSVCGLIEHYKDPNCCMFFEPMLTLPLTRSFPFTLQHLCRAAICSKINYDSINHLLLPKSLHEYLRYYHYKQKVGSRRFDAH